MTKYRSTLVGFSVALLGALALHLAASADTSSSSATPAPAASPVLVTIKDFAFSPSVVSIPVGGSVTFKNLDQAAHTATDSNKAFDSGNLDTGKSYTYTFTKAGTYKIICLYHPSMKGTVVVGSTATPPLPTPDSGY